MPDNENIQFIIKITLELFNQIGIIILSVFLFSLLKKRLSDKKNHIRNIVIGFYFGAAAFISMLYPITIKPGVYVDGRLIIVSVSALWGGPLAGIISAGTASIIRIIIGGMGAFAGVFGTIAGATIGTLLYYLVKNHNITDLKRSIQVYIFQGVLLSVSSRIMMLLMPIEDVFLQIVRTAIPTLIYNIFGAALFNILLYREGSLNNLEKEIKVSKKHFQALFHQAGDGLFLLNKDFKILDVNEIAVRESGYRKNKLLSMSIQQMEDHFPELSIESELKKALIINSTFTFETDMKNRHGHTIPVELRVTKVVVDKEVFLLVLTRNISLRRNNELKIKKLNEQLEAKIDFRTEELAQALVIVKQQQQDLARSEAQFRSAFEYAGHGVVLANPKGHFLKANRAFCNIIGYQHDEVLRLDYEKITYSEDYKNEKLYFDKLIAGDIEVFDLEKTFIHKKEFPVWVFISVTLVRDDYDDPVYFIGHVIDISKQKETQSALKESEARYRLLFKTMEQGVVYQNKEGNIISANPAAERILGLTFDQMRGRTSIDPRWRSVREDGSDFPGEEHPAMIALKTGLVVKNVIMGVYCLAEEDYRWIVVNAVPEFQENENEPYQVYTTFTDITVRKEMEDRLEQIAHYDHVTNIPNRYLFYKRIRDAYIHYKNYNAEFVLLYLDLDGFKLVNDNYGHSAGDFLLKTIAERIVKIIRHSDTVARLGGDEFIVILSALQDRQNIIMVTEKIASAIKEDVHYNGEIMNVGTSIGIACCPEDTEDVDQIIKLADSAMYYAKNTGKDRYIFYSDIK